MDRVAIRRATSSDVLVLLEMMAFFNAVEEIPWSAAVIEPALRHLLASPELGFVLVAMVGQKDVGYAVVTFNYDLKFAGRDAFVTELFVRPQHRRTGVARRLLAVIEANAGIEGTHARAKG
jgi:GNAT superfamily N-acetyltransferase